MPPQDVPIRGESIDLDQFLKLIGVAGSGGHAKHLIQAGDVTVNGQPETRRRRMLKIGDVITVEEQTFRIQAA